MEAPERPAQPRGMSRGLAFILLALVCVPYLVGLGDPPLWDANEPLYAEPPREVLEHGDWLSPTWNYKPWFVRPPLSTWITVPFYWAFGVSPFSERLPMAIAAIATIVATYALGAALGGRRIGVLAAVVLASTTRYWLTARQLSGDVYMTACLVSAFALAAPLLAGRPEGRRRILFAHGLVAIGVLAKGPAILVLYALPLLIVARLRRPRIDIRSLRPLAAVLLVLGLGVPWFVYMTIRHGTEYLAVFIGHQHLQRIIADEFKPRAPWFLFQAILGDGQPWILLVPFAVAEAVRAIRGGRRDPLLILAWVAGLLPLVLFSIPAGKRNVYLLPGYPMLAVGLAPFVAEVIDGLHRTMTRWIGALAAVACAAGVWMLIETRSRAPDDLAAASAPFLVVVAAAVIVFGVMAWRRSGAGLVRALAAFPLGAVTLAAILMPAFSRYMPVPRLAKSMAARLEPGDLAILYRVPIHSLMFYLSRPTVVAGDHAALLAAIPPGHRAIVLGQDDEIAAFEREGGFLVSAPIDRAPYYQLQFRRNVLGDGPSTRDLVLVVVERAEATRDHPR
jgi:4-amino-4-deoxy-L-arabinose transferase-like glycosyltransferase